MKLKNSFLYVVLAGLLLCIVSMQVLPQADVPDAFHRYTAPITAKARVIRASTLLKSTVSNLPVVDSRAQEMSRKNLPSSTFPAKNCLPILQKTAQSFQGDHHRAPVGGFRPSHGRSFIQTGKREPLIASDGLLPSPACKLGMAANGGTAASTSATSVSQRGACTEGIELQSTSCEHPGR